MAKKLIVRLPGGGKVHVTAPDNADDESVLKFVRDKLASETQARENKKNREAAAKHDADIARLKDDVEKFGKLLARLTDKVERLSQKESPQPNIKIMPDPDLAEAITKLKEQKKEVERFDIESDSEGRVKSVIPVFKQT